MDTIKSIFNQLVVVLEDDTKINILELDDITDVSELAEDREDKEKTINIINIISDVTSFKGIKDLYDFYDKLEELEYLDRECLEYIEVFKDWEGLNTIINAYNNGQFAVYESERDFVYEMIDEYAVNIPSWVSIDYDHTFKELSYDFYTYEERYNGLYIWYA